MRLLTCHALIIRTCWLQPNCARRVQADSMSELISDLEITGLVHGGRGIGRIDGKAIFVPMTAPGDRVICRVVRTKSSYIEAELVNVVEPSAHRRQPPCPYFGRCGGCQW